MEEVIMRYTKKHRKNKVIIEKRNIYGSLIATTIYYKCCGCGRFKAPSETERCDKCLVQTELFI